MKTVSIGIGEIKKKNSRYFLTTPHICNHSLPILQSSIWSSRRWINTNNEESYCSLIYLNNDTLVYEEKRGTIWRRNQLTGKYLFGHHMGHLGLHWTGETFLCKKIIKYIKMKKIKQNGLSIKCNNILRLEWICKKKSICVIICKHYLKDFFTEIMTSHFRSYLYTMNIFFSTTQATTIIRMFFFSSSWMIVSY